MSHKKHKSELTESGNGHNVDQMEIPDTQSYAQATSVLGEAVQEIAGKEKELHEKVEKLQDDIEKYKEKTYRAAAEVENMRRIAQRDIANAHKYALEKIVLELVAVLDSLERALEGPAPATEAELLMRQGIEMTFKMFLDALAKFNVAQINPVGEVFNVDVHEAVSMVAAGNVPPNTIVSVMQRGYTLNGRVLRPARVVVAKT